MFEQASREALSRTVAAIAATLGADSAIAVGVTLRADSIASAAGAPGTTLPRLDVSLPEASGGARAPAEFELTRLLGQGGMGAVWLARQRALDREVAVKRLAGDGTSPGAAAALLLEARATGALEHPSVVPVHALGAGLDGSPMLVMKRVEGTTLEALIADPEHPSWPALERRHGDRLLAQLEVLARVADALELAHSRGIVHRDVKPENIMVGAFGETYLLDWGVALTPASRAASPGKAPIVGTPCFMAPEMIEGTLARIGARTDVYLLGGTLHTVLTGSPRHEGQDLHTVLLSALLSDPPEHGPEVPAELAALVRRATARDPEDRPADAATFREALSEYRRHRGSLALTREAEAKLLALPAEPTPETLAAPETSRAIAEARFGLTHALVEWPENEAARAALERTRRLAVEVELARGSHETAAALLSELAAPDPALGARIDAGRREAEQSARLADVARAEALERDPGVRAGVRVIFIGILALFSVVVSGLYLGYFADAAPDARSAHLSGLFNDAGQLSVVVLGLVIFRKRLLANRWGRRVLGALVLAGVLSMVATVGVILRNGSEQDNMSIRGLVFAAVFAAYASDLSRRLWPGAALAVIASLVTSVNLTAGTALLFVTMMYGLAVIVWESLRPS